jgi:hypothetical protein
MRAQKSIIVGDRYLLIVLKRDLSMNSITSTHSLQTSLHLGSNDVAKDKYENSTTVKIHPSDNEKTVSKGLPEDKVSISAEAAEKQLKEEKTASVDASDSAKQKSIQELAEDIKQKTIDDIKERIENVTEALQAAKIQDDESSKEQAKLLQSQLNDLNAQLLTLMTG